MPSPAAGYSGGRRPGEGVLAFADRYLRLSSVDPALDPCPAPDLLSAALDSGSEAGRERVRLAVTEFGLAFFESDLAAGTVLMTPNGFAMLGLPEPAAPALLDRAVAWSVYHPHDLAAARAKFAADLAGERGRDDYRERVRILRADDGRLRWIEFTGRMFGPPGARTHIVGMLRDVTAEVEAAERRALLSREVEHRANNLLAIVQALVRLTAGADTEDYRANLEGRIMALARSQAIAQAPSRPAALATLIEGELGAYADHVDLQIEAVPPIDPAAIQPLAMVLHELATNAAKHGALAVPEGRVAIAARMRGGALDLVWTETGGPPIETPPRRRGTGLGVVRAQARRLGASLGEHWDRDGLRIALTLPAPAERNVAAAQDIAAS